MATTKTPKQVQILARYIHKTDGKPNGRISYLVRSSDGKSEYCTTLIDGHAVGCSCPSRKPCYHEKQLEAREQESRVSAQEALSYEAIVASRFATENLPMWVSAMVAKRVLSVPALPIAKSLPAEPQVRGKVAKSVDIGAKGTLNGNRGFSILKQEVA
jgi:hypothetical protein